MSDQTSQYMLDGESFQKVDARTNERRSINDQLLKLWGRALTETFLALLALIDHAEEQMAFSSKNRIDAHLELNIAIEDV